MTSMSVDAFSCEFSTASTEWCVRDWEKITQDSKKVGPIEYYTLCDAIYPCRHHIKVDNISLGVIDSCRIVKLFQKYDQPTGFLLNSLAHTASFSCVLLLIRQNQGCFHY